MQLEDFRVEIVPSHGEMVRVSMSRLMPERSSDPAHRMFYSHILGFHRLPNPLASLFPEVYRATLKAERWLQFRFSPTERIVCILGR